MSAEMLKQHGWEERPAGVWRHPVAPLAQFTLDTAMEIVRRVLTQEEQNNQLPDEEWEPLPSDVAWQEAMCNRVKEGGGWGIPESKSLFLLQPSKKIATMTLGDPKVSVNFRAIKTFKKIGWTVEIVSEGAKGHEKPTSEEETDGGKQEGHS